MFLLFKRLLTLGAYLLLTTPSLWAQQVQVALLDSGVDPNSGLNLLEGFKLFREYQRHIRC